MRGHRSRDDQAINEVLGFVLSFALSAIFLMIAMSSFWTAKANSESVLTGTEMKAVADRVASAVVQAGLIGQEFPNATFNQSLAIPQLLNDHDYYVQGTPSAIYVNSTDGTYTATATTFKLDAVTSLWVTGVAYSSNEKVLVEYTPQKTHTDPVTGIVQDTITISG